MFVDKIGAVAGELVFVRRFESDKFEWNNLAPVEAGSEFDKLTWFGPINVAVCDVNGGGVPFVLLNVNGDLFNKLVAVWCNSCGNFVWLSPVELSWDPVCASGGAGAWLGKNLAFKLFAIFVGDVIGVVPMPAPFGGLFSGICKTELSDGGLMSALLKVAEFNWGFVKSAVGDGVAKILVGFKTLAWFIVDELFDVILSEFKVDISGVKRLYYYFEAL